ncbi:MAG: outer membrane beta-barrel protein [Bacteroidales bacterium]|jgi:hypothetical protein|nr:outer membrane beta-barrel protein [Bacteroidales bacterium]MDD4209240.1 outer membrane beta-barrel protein [Bacteroidales bacterium]MDY0016122.1 outer membrane beta-barrel protein [Bacteroidales bacterium]
MKKLLLFCIAFVVFTISGNAQLERNLGLRLGGNTELSFQYGFGTGDRVDVSAGIGFDKQKDSAFSTSINFNVMYMYAYNFSGSWFVYGGFGGGLESDFKTFKIKNLNPMDYFYFKIGIDVGLEYQFDDPIAVFVEYRPELVVDFKDKSKFQVLGVSLGARYMF